ncbi:MAG: helix-turn-helix transcriptional regulator [Polyangiaceae bacterium]
MDRETLPRETREKGRETKRTLLPWASRADEGLVRVREYHCTACMGDPPSEERFERASIAVVRAGVFGIRTEKHPRILSAGFLLLGNAGQNYEASHEHAVGDRCLVFDFHGLALENLAETLRKGAGREPFSRNVLPPDPRVDAIRVLAEEALAGEPTSASLEELGLWLGAHAIDLAGQGTARSESDPTKGRKARDIVVGAMTSIERSSERALPLADLASAAKLTPFHFLRLFKRETGMTPHRFLLQTRIRRAIPWLRETSRPITEIAYAVGFGDLSNFINTFRREIGCSPRQYRQSGLSGLPARPRK